MARLTVRPKVDTHQKEKNDWFVENHLVEIRLLEAIFQHQMTQNNPADIITRGLEELENSEL